MTLPITIESNKAVYTYIHSVQSAMFTNFRVLNVQYDVPDANAISKATGKTVGLRILALTMTRKTTECKYDVI